MLPPAHPVRMWVAAPAPWLLPGSKPLAAPPAAGWARAPSAGPAPRPAPPRRRPQNATDNGRGKVLANAPADRVFVYYSDHGAPGILGMPSGPFLYADQLNAVGAGAGRWAGGRGWAVREVWAGFEWDLRLAWAC